VNIVICHTENNTNKLDELELIQTKRSRKARRLSVLQRPG